MNLVYIIHPDFLSICNSTTMKTKLFFFRCFPKPSSTLFAAFIIVFGCICTKLEAQNPKPEANSVAIYYNQLYNDTVKGQCWNCLPVYALKDKLGVLFLDREKINLVKQEIDLSNSGLVTDETKVKPGHILIPERLINATGINYFEANGIALDAYVNYSFTDLETGKITYSKSCSNAESVLDDIKKVALRTYTPPLAGAIKQERAIRSVSVDLPVDYDFKFKGVFPEEGEDPVVRESDKFFVLKDGQATDPKKTTLAFSALYGAEGSYSKNSFKVVFKPSLTENEQICLEGTFSDDRSKILSARITHNYLYEVGDDPSYMVRESSADNVTVENLVYNKNNMGGTYEFVPGVSKIVDVNSQINFYETGEMPLRTLTATHNLINIGAGPKIYMMAGIETKIPSKPLKKIYLRGNWTGYAFITEALLKEFPTAEIFDQTDNYIQKVRYERSLNLPTGQVATISGMDSPAQPQANQAIITFNVQITGNGGKTVSVDIQTSTRSNSLSFSQPALFKNYAESADDKDENVSESKKNLSQQAEFLFYRTQSLAKLIVKELNK